MKVVLSEETKMAWNSECGCQWECCTSSAKTKINSKHFWESLNDMKNKDYTFQPTNRFIFEKLIHLNNDDEHQTTLSIGLDPENEFHVAGRLEVRKSTSSLFMNFKQLKNLLNFLKDYEDHILQTLPVKDTYSKYCLLLHQRQARILELCMHGWSVNIDEDSLKTMCRMRLHIQRLISSLEIQAEKCERLFFKLLSHFCYRKTVQDSFDLAETYYKQGFFEELITFHCDCLDKQFIVEIALHFDKWFELCISYFIDTMMLYESQRLQTYSSIEWPHNKGVVSIEKLAKSGLFYVGTSDNVQCAFCGIVLHNWKPNDDPVLDHFKYMSSCRFLKNPILTPNVSDVGKINELKALLSILDKESIDEVD